MSGIRSVLFVPASTGRVAATRYRVLQYVPLLEARGITCRVYAAISDGATRLMLSSTTLTPWRRRAYYVRIMAERIIRFAGIIAIAHRYDVIFLQRSTFPFGLERLLAARAKAIIFDFDDSIYRSDPDDRETGWVGRLKERTKASEVSGILRVSRAAVVENGFLRQYAERFCRDVVTIPGPLDTDHFKVKNKYNEGPVVIGWIGSPSTTAYLPMIDDSLAAVQASHSGARIRLIGAGVFGFCSARAESVSWSLESEASELQSFDIGVMPMPHNDWTDGKLGVKMLLYMASGVPAVVSYTATNAEVIEHGVNGFLARTPGEWREILLLLAKDPALRRRVGAAGRKTVEEGYSLKSGMPALLELLTRIGSEAS